MISGLVSSIRDFWIFIPCKDVLRVRVRSELTLAPTREVPFTTDFEVGATLDLTPGSPALSASVFRFGSGSEKVLLCFNVEGGAGSIDLGLAFVCDSVISTRLFPGDGILLGGRI